MELKMANCYNEKIQHSGLYLLFHLLGQQQKGFVKLCNTCSLVKFQGISKLNPSSLAPCPFGSTTFLHRINTSRIKIRPELRTFIFILQRMWKADITTIMISENNSSH